VIIKPAAWWRHQHVLALLRPRELPVKVVPAALLLCCLHKGELVRGHPGLTAVIIYAVLRHNQPRSCRSLLLGCLAPAAPSVLLLLPINQASSQRAPRLLRLGGASVMSGIIFALVLLEVELAFEPSTEPALFLPLCFAHAASIQAGSHRKMSDVVRNRSENARRRLEERFSKLSHDLSCC
jgi:hypothetical protein